MAKSTGSEKTTFSPYLDTVIDAEKAYLKKRRRKNGLSKPEDDDLWGLSVSGGGIRSATWVNPADRCSPDLKRRRVAFSACGSMAC